MGILRRYPKLRYRLERQILLWIGAIMLSFTVPESEAMQSRAKNIDYTPDITSEAYWASHYIGVVRLTRIAFGDHRQRLVTYEVTRALSNGGMETLRTVSEPDLWFGMDAGEPPNLAAGQELVLYQAKQGKSSLAVTRVDAGSREQLGALVEIARLRRDP